ncbi:hypothetical protein CISIN_1g037689mg [Citrus sinensis]|uniref:HMA domain-containing protein n=1 Tax=Citrus sinensis TaxID=2711 RepID=A0A067GHX8_CITSI|nr:hypothetical protein CISIN_1g037689mg [Citrus sinensis]
MYCNACERTVARAISKFKGVEKFTTDMNKHRVVVTGRIDPQKVLKKLKKKTGKKVEIVDNNNNNNNEESPKGCSNNEENEDTYRALLDKTKEDLAILFDCCKYNDEVVMMFSDENPNACSIM